MSAPFRHAPRPRHNAPDGAAPTRDTGPRQDSDAVDRYEAARESIVSGPGQDLLPAPMLDGYLCGVLLQPVAVPVSRWWPAVVDPDGAAPAAAGTGSPVLEALREIALARHAELDTAIRARSWFDPWILDLAPHDAELADDRPDPDVEPVDALAMPDDIRDAIYPWVAGFAHAMATFQDLLELADPAAAEPQALLCQFLDPDELEDADALFELIESFEPPLELGDAVESLVRATLLLADITRPMRPVRPTRPTRPAPPRRPVSRAGSRRS